MTVVGNTAFCNADWLRQWHLRVLIHTQSRFVRVSDGCVPQLNGEGPFVMCMCNNYHVRSFSILQFCQLHFSKVGEKTDVWESYGHWQGEIKALVPFFYAFKIVLNCFFSHVLTFAFSSNPKLAARWI